MKPAPFTYHRAHTVRHAVDLLAARRGALVLAGGQSLIPRLNARLDRPTDLVDVTGVPGLDRIRLLADGHLSVGATARHRELCATADHAVPPVLSAAALLVGSTAVRALGTSVGSIAFADPAAEIPAVLRLLGGRVHLASVRGFRTVTAHTYLAAAPADRLARDELITSVDFLVPPSDAGTAVTEVSSRHGDRALAGAAALVRLAADGTLAEVRVCLWGTTSVPLLADLTGRNRGRRLQEVDDWGDQLGDTVATLDPPGLAHASPAYLRHLAAVTARRALASAARRAAPPNPAGRGPA